MKARLKFLWYDESRGQQGENFWWPRNEQDKHSAKIQEVELKTTADPIKMFVRVLQDQMPTDYTVDSVLTTPTTVQVIARQYNPYRKVDMVREYSATLMEN